MTKTAQHTPEICEIEDCGDAISPDTGLCPHHLQCHRLDGELEERKDAIAKARG